MLMDAQETVSLIGSDKVQGTAVFGPDGQKIGSIERVMIEKFNGKVSYAVLSFGGLFGIGDNYYPLPWPSLKYNVELVGYQTMITNDQLRKAPRYARSSEWNWNDQQLARSVSAYYGFPLP
jgi:PRC-barrel domain